MVACRSELLPFCYITLVVNNKRFFLVDQAAKLYSPSAYYAAQLLAGARQPAWPAACQLPCLLACLLDAMCCWQRELARHRRQDFRLQHAGCLACCMEAAYLHCRLCTKHAPYSYYASTGCHLKFCVFEQLCLSWW